MPQSCSSYLKLPALYLYFTMNLQWSWMNHIVLRLLWDFSRSDLLSFLQVFLRSPLYQGLCLYRPKAIVAVYYKDSKTWSAWDSEVKEADCRKELLEEAHRDLKVVVQCLAEWWLFEGYEMQISSFNGRKLSQCICFQTLGANKFSRCLFSTNLRLFSTMFA